MNEHVAPSKFRRFRERKRAAGLREIRLWVFDVNAPAFKDQLARESALIDVDPDDEWQGFVDAEMSSWDDWTVAGSPDAPADAAR